MLAYHDIGKYAIARTGDNAQTSQEAGPRLLDLAGADQETKGD
jgi:hypothetical protein